MSALWSQESKGNKGLFLTSPMLAGQGQWQQEQEHKEGNRDPPGEQKGGARQGVEADPSLEEEGGEWQRP